ncbi:MAG: DNA translocase FtsK [bacterium]
MARRRGRRKKPFRIKLRKEILYSVISIIFVVLALIILLSFTREGAFLEGIYLVLSRAFGWTILIVPFLLLTIALMMTQLKWAITSPTLFLGGTLLFLGSLGLSRAGELGTQIFVSLAALLTSFGATVVYLAVFVVGGMIITNTPLEDVLLFLVEGFNKVIKAFHSVKSGKGDLKLQKTLFPDTAKTKINIPGSSESTSPAPSKQASSDELDFATQIVSRSPGETIWKYPPVSLLSTEKGAKADRGDIKENAHIIESTLESFGIKAKVVEVNGGPAITQYAIRIAEGTKLSKIKALQTDLALTLAAPTGQIRIEAPIPGRNLVGIEVPNVSMAYVTLHEILTHSDFKKEKSHLAIGLGLGVSGSPAIADIKKMPHALVAGATGSGKSICINNIICTLLFRNSPSELKLILVDPKRVELTAYNGIPHLLTPVITESERVIAALNWATKEMDKRYKMFAEVGARNIEEYNEFSGFTAMYYLVIVIDELADIMLIAPSKVEDLITRIAQMARATGIHLILATQRPSVNIITGLIKANIPTRIAFNVTSMIDSRVIIDSPGAEKLLGRGDMLYVPPDRPLPTRIQGTYVTNQEINNLIDYLKSCSSEPIEYQEEVTEKYLPGNEPAKDESEDRDELFMDAVRVVCSAGKASTSYIQRRLSVGYNRAAKIIDQLEKAGVVGPADGVKPRIVLVSSPDQISPNPSSSADPTTV